MEFEALEVNGAWKINQTVHRDHRGLFFEAFSKANISDNAQLSFPVAQVNVSSSRAGVVRGIHVMRRPPGQAKLVTCLVGSILDVVVDLRRESPTFGSWEAVELVAPGEEDTSIRSILISEGLGHGFQVLSETATVMYATTSAYDPAAEFAVDPMDPHLRLPWRDADRLILSAKDAAAPSVDRLLRLEHSPFAIGVSER